jgi:hypothetical protein
MGDRVIGHVRSHGLVWEAHHFKDGIVAEASSKEKARQKLIDFEKTR